VTNTVLLSHTQHVAVTNTGDTTMKSQKFLHIRIPADFHRQLVKYAEDRFVPVSSVVLQAVAQTIGYKPLDEFGLAPDTDDLQRRAAAAPFKPL
jgi:hypothetical protein